MQPTAWIRAALLGILIVALGIPPGAVTAALAQQEGPQTPPPAQQPEQPMPPTAPPQSQPQAQPQQKTPPLPQVSISVESNLVNVDATVTDQDGNIVTGLKKQNFRIFDNDQPQEITNFAPSDAPITICILMEFSSRAWGYFGYKAQEWAYNFLGHLNPQDWVALKTFDLKATIRVDFTQNKNEVEQAIATLGYTGFSEDNLFDSLLETLDQMRDVRGRKAILLIATGFDTLSRHTLDETYHRVRETDTTIFCVGMGEEIDLYAQGSDITYLQAKNELTTFANWTGGYAWFPRFQGEMNDIFNSVATYLRSQYTLGFVPSTPHDGKYHVLRVDVVDDQGSPLTLANKKGKQKKVVVYARHGYTSQTTAASD
ncbi:MAG: VWA domain-containing protein [Candidatus Acidiferrales bacterium]